MSRPVYQSRLTRLSQSPLRVRRPCPFPLQASQTPGDELPGGHRLCLQQPDVRGRTPGPAHPAGVQAPGDGQSQQAAVCAVEPQQSVSARRPTASRSFSDLNLH